MNLQFKLCPKEFNKRLGPGTKIAIRDDAEMIAFSDKDCSVLLYQKSNHRIETLLTSEHPVSNLLFSRSYLFASTHSTHQILVFSLKTLKLKKKLTSHRTRILKLDYNSNRHLVLTLSTESCILWNSVTLTKEKTLNCSTSFFVDSTFTSNGQYLVNLFDDGNVFFWRLEDYQETQTVVRGGGVIGLAASKDQYLAVADTKTLSITNFVYDKINFETASLKIAGNIEGIKFFQTLLLVKTSQGLYGGSVTESFRIHLNMELLFANVREFAISYSCDFLAIVTNSNDIYIATLNPQRFLEETILTENTWEQITNPLNNVAGYCAGGFSNKLGCDNIEHLPPTHNYQKNQQNLEKIYKSALISVQDLKDFSREKLAQFLRKNHRFVDKHRAITYKYLLDLPSNLLGFKRLLREGVHECTKMLSAKYPIKNVVLLQKMKTVQSLLAHYSPVFAQADNIPGLIFPLVTVLGEDELLCFETLHKLLTYWLRFLFETFPVANPDVLQNIEQILESIEPSVGRHFAQRGLSMTKLIWEPLSTFFSDVLDRQGYLTLVDTLFCYRQSPELVFFMIITFIVQNASSLNTLQSDAELDQFLNSQMNLHPGKFLNLLFKLHSQHKSKMRYKFKLTEPWGSREYGIFDGFPREAIQIYRAKRQLQHKDFEYELERQRYTKAIQDKMNVVAVEQRRRIQRQAKLSQAHMLRFQTQQKKLSTPPPPPTTQHKRISQLKQVISLMQQNIHMQQRVSKTLKDIPLALPLNPTRHVELQQLDKLQHRLIKMMIDQSPQPIISHLVHPLVVTQPSKQPELMKTMMNVELLEGIRRIGRLEQENQEKKWEKELMRAYEKTK